MATSPLKSDFQLPTGTNLAGINLQELLGTSLFEPQTVDVSPIEAQQAFQTPGNFGLLLRDRPTDTGFEPGTVTDTGLLPTNLSDLPDFSFVREGGDVVGVDTITMLNTLLNQSENSFI